MLSAFPAMLPSDGSFGFSFPSLEPIFPSWDCQESPLVFHHKPVNSNLGSDESKPTSQPPNSGSEEPIRIKKSCKPGSVDGNLDERKRKRMLSNRESARRSRMRKQKHLENLRNQVNRIKMGNREMTNRLHLVTYHCQATRRDNDRLRSELGMLRQRLWDIYQVLRVRQLQHQLCLSPAALVMQ